MGLKRKLFGRGEAKAQPPSANSDMISIVVLSKTHVELTVDTLRAHLDELYPGEFLPPRETGNFVIDGPVPGAQFLVQSNLPGAGGTFLLHSV